MFRKSEITVLQKKTIRIPTTNRNSTKWEPILQQTDPAKGAAKSVQITLRASDYPADLDRYF